MQVHPCVSASSGSWLFVRAMAKVQKWPMQDSANWAVLIM